MKKCCYIYRWIVSILAFVCVLPTVSAAGKDEFVVVLDAGHGGKDMGAVDNNVKEKDINLGVAKELASILRKEIKDVKVVMTRDNDSFISLNDRAEVANRNKGNLFISIHTNSVDKSNADRKSVAGASVYALGLHKDKNNLQVARRENSVIELEKNYEQKYSGFDPSKDESYIIFEMAQKKNLGQSLKFANEAQKQLVKTAGRRDRGVKQAGFWVLWATSMPAVLVELDFICNPNSAIYMASSKGQKQLARALGNAVKEYVDNYRNTGKNVNNKRIAKQPTERENTATHELAVVRSDERGDVPPAIAGRANNRIARKRRGASSRQLSDKRVVETGTIPLHSETEYLAKAEVMPAEQATYNDKDRNENSTKSSKTKNKKEKKNKQKDNSEKIRTNNNKKIVISKADDKSSESVKPRRHKSISGHKSKVERLETVYKIQVLVSGDDLRENNPRFCGLQPIVKFKENNLYKYTYGESSNRREMEKLLKEVKKVIPDAFIITSKR